MKRLFIAVLIGFAGLLAGCGSSTSSSPQANANNFYTVVITPTQLTLNSGDFASISAIVFLSQNNGAPKAVSPQPAIKFFSSDARVTISPKGEVCAGLWDAQFLTCTATATLPSGFVTVTATDAAHTNLVNGAAVAVTGTMQVSVHLRAARITLSAPVFSGVVTASLLSGTTTTVTNIPLGQYPSTTGCVSQRNFAAGLDGNGNPVPVSNNHVQYIASAVDSNGLPILSCANSPTPGCIHDDDYTWTTASASVAQVDRFGSVVAGNPGVTNVFATLDGTVSEPLAFATCPPDAIVLSTSPFIANTNPVPPFTTDDLTLNKGEQRYLNATLVDSNGNTLVSSPLTYMVSDPPAVILGPPFNLSVGLTAISAGRFTVTAGCSPPECNPSVADFISPAGPQSAEAVGFGHPVYSNVIGATVQGSTGSAVLVTGAVLASDGVTEARRLLVYDSESMALNATVALGNVPNSLVVAPNGTQAYLGSCDGLIVVNLTSFQTSLQTFPVTGQLSTAVVTGKVLGVSPDSRYVVVSDNDCPSVPSNPASPPNHQLYLIDTTGTKAAALFQIPNVTSATFAGDDTNIWVGGDSGVFVFQADTFVPIPDATTVNVTSMAWMPDGQSFFASGNQLTDYHTCENQLNQTFQSPLSSVPGGLVTAVPPAVDGSPETSHMLGLDFNAGQWFDYAVTNSAQVPTMPGQPTPTGLIPTPLPQGNVCLSTVTPTPAGTPPVPAPPCNATQLSFAPKLQEVFATGVDSNCAPDSTIHGYAPFGLPPSFNTAPTEVPLTTTNPLVPLSGPVVPLSGGVLSDGRKLFYGTYDSSTHTAVLHRIDLATSTGVPSTPQQEDKAVPVSVKPSFVAVVPK